jgi:hypothetical protein
MTEALGVALIVLGIALVLIIGARSSTRRASLLKLKPTTPVSPEPPPPLPPPPAWPPNTLEELVSMSEASATAAEARDEREAEVRRSQAEKEERAAEERKYLRIVGFFGRLATYGALFFAVYIYAPKDISHTPLAALTLGDITGTILAIVITFALIRALFNPSDDDQTKDAWGYLGVLYLGVAFMAYFYFAPHNGMR